MNKSRDIPSSITDDKATSEALVKQDKDGWTALHTAARHQSPAAFQALIAKADAKAINEALVKEAETEDNKWTNALEMAVRHQDFASIIKLIEKASPFVIDACWNGVLSNAKQVINYNNSLSRSEKKEIKSLLDKHHSFLDDPENGIRNPKEFIGFVKQHLHQKKWHDADKWLTLLRKVHFECPDKKTRGILATLTTSRCLRHYYQIKQVKKAKGLINVIFKYFKDMQDKIYINTFQERFPINSIDYAEHCTPEDNLTVAEFLYHATPHSSQLPASLASLSEAQLKMRALIHGRLAAICNNQQAIQFLNFHTDPISVKMDMLRKLHSDLTIPIDKEINEKIINTIINRFYPEKQIASRSERMWLEEKEEDALQRQENFYVTLREILETLNNESKATPPQKIALLKSDIQVLTQVIQYRDKIIAISNNPRIIKEELNKILAPLTAQRLRQSSDFEIITSEEIKKLEIAIRDYKSDNQDSSITILILATQKIGDIIRALDEKAASYHFFDGKPDKESQSLKKDYENYQRILPAIQAGLNKLKETILTVRPNRAESKITTVPNVDNNILCIQYYVSCFAEVYKPLSSSPTLFQATREAKDDPILRKIEQLKEFRESSNPNTIEKMKALTGDLTNDIARFLKPKTDANAKTLGGLLKEINNRLDALSKQYGIKKGL